MTLALLLAAAFLEIVTTTTIEDETGQLVVPCVVNHDTRPHRARVRAGGAVFDDPLKILPGQTACFRLDAGFMRGRGRYELEVEARE